MTVAPVIGEGALQLPTPPRIVVLNQAVLLGKTSVITTFVIVCPEATVTLRVYEREKLGPVAVSPSGKLLLLLVVSRYGVTGAVGVQVVASLLG
jgi:hypothetical protein